MSPLLLLTLAHAATLDRAPYLQMTTPTGVTIVWRTEVGASTRLLAGPTLSSLSPVPEVEHEEDPAEAPDSGTETGTEPPPVLADQHEARIEGLSPSTTWHYAVEVDGVVVTDGLTFTTAPAVGSGAPVLAWIVGDSGTNTPIQHYVRDAMRDHLGERLPDLYLHLGDMAYGDGTDEQFTERFYGVYADELSRVPVWPTIGNHEGNSADSVTNTGPYYEGYVLPTQGEAGGLPSGSEAYYSFDWSDIHFVVLDSHGSDRTPEGPMLTWLAQDLELTEQRWIVATFHHPPYTKGSHDSDRERGHIDMRENALPILEAGGVDLVLGGHSHIYERSYLAQGGYETPSTDAGIVDRGNGRIGQDGPYRLAEGLTPGDGTLFVVAGHGGTGVQREGRHPLLFWAEPDNGSVLMHVDGDAMSLRNIRWDGVVTDTVALVKGDPFVLGTPNGDHPILSGVPTEITWTGARGDGEVELTVSCDGGRTWETLATTEDDGAYTWDTPLWTSPSVRVKARQLAHDQEDVSDTDVRLRRSTRRLAVPFTSVFRHLTDGTDPGADWMSPSFDDSTWTEGRAPIGYGYDDELTPLEDLEGTVLSHYFRGTVQVQGQVTEAILRLEYDDGMVLFVNGVEAVRANLDSLDHAAQAPAPAEEPAREYEILDPSLFHEGSNTLAVLVKQHIPEPDPTPDTGAPPDNHDLRFDMSLELAELQPLATERCPPDIHHEPEPDAEVPEIEPPPKEGCGCATTAGSAGGLLLFGGLVGLVARRRQEDE